MGDSPHTRQSARLLPCSHCFNTFKRGNNMSATQHTSSVKKAALSIGAILLLSVLGAAPAMAKACKNVHIEAKNLTGQSITIVDLDYWDSESEKWRSEPLKNVPLKQNRTWQVNRHLERVNGQSVKVKVKYKYRAKHKYNKLLFVRRS